MSESFQLSLLGPDGPWVDFSPFVLVLFCFVTFFVLHFSGCSMIISFL